MAKKPSEYLKNAKKRLQKRKAKKRAKKNAKDLKKERDTRAVRNGRKDKREASLRTRARAKKRALKDEAAAAKREASEFAEELPGSGRVRQGAQKLKDTAGRIDSTSGGRMDPMAGAAEPGLQDGDLDALDLDDIGTAAPGADLQDLDPVDGRNGQPDEIDLDRVENNLDGGFDVGNDDI